MCALVKNYIKSKDIITKRVINIISNFKNNKYIETILFKSDN